MKTTPRNWIRTFSVTALAGLSLAGAKAQDAAADAKLSQALGFASRLSSDTEIVMGLRNFAQLAETVGGSKTWKAITGLVSEGAGVDLDDATEIWNEVLKYVGKDAFVAFGGGTDVELGHLMEVYDAYYRIYYRFAVEGMLAGMGIGDGPEGGREIETVVEEALKADDGKLLSTLEKLQVPPMVAGARVPKGKAEELVEKLTALEAELPPIVVTSEFDVAGAGKFRSWALAAKDAFADEMREKMREEIGNEELAAQLEKIIDSKKVEFSFGAVGDYIVVGVGPGHAHVKFAASGAESLLSKPDFKFLQGYADKKLVAYSYAAKGVLDALNRPEQVKTITDAVSGLLQDMVGGGIDVKGAIPLVDKLGTQLVAASKREVDSTAGVIYMEDGLKGASIGGYTMPGMDAKTPLKLAGAVPEDAFLTINGASDPGAADDGIAMMETLGSAAYQIAAGVAKTNGEGEFAEQFGMMDELFRPKLLKVWGIMRDKVAKGLGEEGGLVIDLAGSMPKIPGAPAVLLKEGKLPRIAIFNTVKERKLLTEAWTELVPVINELAKTIPGQEPGREFQVPDPLSSDGKTVKTHFMGLPFVSNDFLPSLSISDDLFFLSTSKNFSEELAAKIAAGGGEEVSGVLVRLRLSALHDYAEGWLDLVLENSAEIFGGNEFAEEDFKDNSERIRMVLGMFGGLKGFEYHRYQGDRMRTDWHFEITDIEG